MALLYKDINAAIVGVGIAGISALYWGCIRNSEIKKYKESLNPNLSNIIKYNFHKSP